MNILERHSTFNRLTVSKSRDYYISKLVLIKIIEYRIGYSLNTAEHFSGPGLFTLLQTTTLVFAADSHIFFYTVLIGHLNFFETYFFQMARI